MRRICSAAVSSRSSVTDSGLRGGHAEAVVARVRRVGENPIARGRRTRLVGTEDVLERDHVRGRLGALEVELADPLDALEDRAELGLHAIELLARQLETREPGDVEDLVAVDHRSDTRIPAP